MHRVWLECNEYDDDTEGPTAEKTGEGGELNKPKGHKGKSFSIYITANNILRPFTVQRSVA